MINFFKNHSGKISVFFIGTLFLYLGYNLYHAPAVGLEKKFLYLMKEYGYIILFSWSILEGETGLVMAGLLSSTGDMNLYLAILVAGLGGFIGDQIYFYIGRYNKKYVYTKFRNQRRKFALAHLLLKKYGWPIIFAQRYMYGMRTIIPISIGLTRYSGKSFALINFISAISWASLTILPVWYFGEEILEILKVLKGYWYFALPVVGLLFWGFISFFNNATKIPDRKNRINNIGEER